MELNAYINFLIQIIVTFSSTDKPDSVVVSSGKAWSRAGDKDKFTCTATGGYPTPTLKLYWTKMYDFPAEITQGQDKVMSKRDNQAEYYCEARVAGYPDLNMDSERKKYNVTCKYL